MNPVQAWAEALYGHGSIDRAVASLYSKEYETTVISRYEEEEKIHEQCAEDDERCYCNQCEIYSDSRYHPAD